MLGYSGVCESSIGQLGGRSSALAWQPHLIKLAVGFTILRPPLVQLWLAPTVDILAELGGASQVKQHARHINTVCACLLIVFNRRIRLALCAEWWGKVG